MKYAVNKGIKFDWKKTAMGGYSFGWYPNGPSKNRVELGYMVKYFDEGYNCIFPIYYSDVFDTKFVTSVKDGKKYIEDHYGLYGMLKKKTKKSDNRFGSPFIKG